MGRDKDDKKKKKNKRSRSDSPPPSQDEEKGKKVKGSSSSSRGDEEEESKRVGKDKKKHKKSHKSSHKEKKSGEKSKVKSHKHDSHSKVKFQELTNDDYFAKNNEFSTWLKEEKKKFFSDLSAESARELFSVFVKDWNNQKLESRYYKGIATGPRSSHKWNIK